MAADPISDGKIVDSWARNAAPWIAAVREGRIESRRQVTDAAVIEAILARAPRTALDIGCGEGWLARELAARGVQVIGIDAIPELVDAAAQAGGGEFLRLSYEALAAGAFDLKVDTAVCNFSLIGKASTEGVVRAAAGLLNPEGALIIQTLHPVTACGDLPYRDGWREGSWAGFDPAFTDPAPWYFRTLEGWVGLFRDCGLCLLETREPQHPKTGLPASVIFVAQPE